MASRQSLSCSGPAAPFGLTEPARLPCDFPHPSALPRDARHQLRARHRVRRSAAGHPGLGRTGGRYHGRPRPVSELLADPAHGLERLVVLPVRGERADRARQRPRPGHQWSGRQGLQDGHHRRLLDGAQSRLRRQPGRGSDQVPRRDGLCRSATAQAGTEVRHLRGRRHGDLRRLSGLREPLAAGRRPVRQVGRRLREARRLQRADPQRGDRRAGLLRHLLRDEPGAAAQRPQDGLLDLRPGVLRGHAGLGHGDQVVGPARQPVAGGRRHRARPGERRGQVELDPGQLQLQRRPRRPAEPRALERPGLPARR